MIQGELFHVDTQPKFPSTRYQGSKLKYVDWIWYNIKDLSFETVLDAFGGTGSVAYKLKVQQKSVTYNDILKFNSIIGRALIENNSVKLDDTDIEYVLNKHSSIKYSSFISRNFSQTYYTDDENEWLDIVVKNISTIECKYKQALAYFALFQSCIIKRPYNLFHRKNLYIRTDEVERSFGNKVTWETPFETHFRNFVTEANNAVFSNNRTNLTMNCDVSKIKGHYDLVYIDTPYISEKKVGVNYRDFYHFLEGIVNYDNWDSMIDYKSKHKRLEPITSQWVNPNSIESAFDELFNKFSKSILVISYRSDGIPNIDALISILKKYKTNIQVHKSNTIKYALSTKQSEEVLIIAQ